MSMSTTTVSTTATDTTMSAGAGIARIALPEGFLPFDGFGTTGADQPLFARAVAFEDARGGRLVVLGIEATSLREPLLSDLRRDAAQAAGTGLDRVWVCVTHSFSIPHVRTDAHVHDSRELMLNGQWRASIRSAARGVVEAACANLRPATLLFGQTTCQANVSRDVETPEGWWLGKVGQVGQGFSDHTVRVLEARDAAGRTIALLTSYDVQSSVMDGVRDETGLKVVSPDMAGLACQAVERALAGDAPVAGQLDLPPVCLFVVGAAGDQMPLVGAGAGADALAPAARSLELAIVRAREGARALAPAAIKTCGLDLELPGQVMPANMRDLRPTRSYERVPAAPHVTHVQLASVAGVPLVGLAPEVSSLMGARIRELADAPRALVLTMVNGAAKYLVEAEAYDRDTYESMNSGFARGAGETLVASVAERLRTMTSI